MIAWLTNPISPLIGGLLGDFVLEPTFSSTGAGALVPAGPGAGMAVLIIVCGLLASLTGLVGYFIPPIFHAEAILPDHDVLPAAETA
jgi:hypothetical protein